MDGLFALLAQLQAWHWFALGLVLLIAEISTGTTYLLWPAVAAALAGVVQLVFPLDWPAQLALFAIATIVLTVTGRTYVRGHWLVRGAHEKLNERAHQLVGQIVTAQDAFAAGVGHVKVGDTIWRASSSETIAKGEALEVTGVDGVTLHVKKPA